MGNSEGSTPFFRNIQREINLISHNIERENDKILQILNESNLVADKKIEYIEKLRNSVEALSHRLEKEIITLEHKMTDEKNQKQYDDFF